MWACTTTSDNDVPCCSLWHSRFIKDQGPPESESCPLLDDIEVSNLSGLSLSGVAVSGRRQRGSWWRGMVAGSSGGIGGGGGWMWIPENNETKLSRCDVPRGRQSPVAASSLYVVLSTTIRIVLGTFGDARNLKCQVWKKTVLIIAAIFPFLSWSPS